MLGAVIGDIVGSRFEWHNHRDKQFDFFSPECFFTDDSVMTLAIAQAILESAGNFESLGEAAVRCMRRIGQPYPDCGYGGNFLDWMYADHPRPYNSYGNGAAMRVSACGWAADSLACARSLSRRVTAVTHNHPEGVKGAEATAVAVFLARQGEGIEAIRSAIEAAYYPLDFTLDDIRWMYTFNETCQETVPQAIEAFLESTDFEDAIRNAVSIGGDSDTLAAITGGIAEAYYGIPDDLRQQALNYLDPGLRQIVEDFERAYGR
ncbi:MAG: ADP-ribosylglycohydrolase family protein [Christensenellales bacterium]|jgi:ADP-ribosylglycohydrolase